MKKILLAASAAAAAFAAVPAQSGVVVTSATGIGTVPSNNEFVAQLGGTSVLLTGVSLNLTAATKLVFEYVGSESGFKNTFSFTSTTTSGSYNETNTSMENLFASPLLIGVGTYNAGSLDSYMKFTSVFGDFAPGTTEFGLVAAPGYTIGGDLSQFYLVFDDNGAGPDDNHDDYIVRVTVVPEPTTWALMIAGIAAVGVSLRRRSQNVRVAFS